MIANKKKFFLGLVMMIGFAIVLFIFFSPIFGGQNGLAYLDNLYNSISKGSAYYIPDVKEEAEAMKGRQVDIKLNMDDGDQAQNVLLLADGSDLEAKRDDRTVTARGDLGVVLASCLSDADAMYHNEGEKLAEKYGIDAKLALFTWWKTLKETERDLKKQKMFEEAKMVDLVIRKAVEASYNYYQIEPQKITDRVGIVIFSLVFYVIYTLWYGFAFMFMFEGWGMRLEH